MLNIIHFVKDEKFIDSLIEMMDRTNSDVTNHFVLITLHRNYCFKYIKKKNRIRIIKPQQVLVYMKEWKANVVILHSLYSIYPLLLVKFPPYVKIVWFAWGYDIYTTIYGHKPLIEVKQLYHEETKKTVCNNRCFNIKSIAVSLRNLFLKGKVELLLSRIDYFSGVIPEEYELIKNNESNTFFRAKPLSFNYTDINSPICAENINAPYVHGHNIQLGNSGDFSNNHIDCMKLLQTINLGGKEIYVPLSYAGTKQYREKVTAYGEQIWGDKFVSLKNFMPLNEYNRTLNTCSYAIFCHERQQAMGNIFTSLWNGCTVFLSSSSIIYDYLKVRGFIVYTIQNDLVMIAKNQTISDYDKMKNRKLLLKYMSPDVQIDKMKLIIKQLNSQE